MAAYLASLSEAPSATPKSAAETVAISDAEAIAAAAREPIGARVFEGACAACHGPDSRIASLALNTNLHAPTANNLIKAIRHGVPAPAGTRNESMAMPGFAGVLDETTMAALIRYLRARFAPGKAPWSGIDVIPGSGGQYWALSQF